MNDLILILACSLASLAVSFVLVLAVAKALERRFMATGQMQTATVITTRATPSHIRRDHRH